MKNSVLLHVLPYKSMIVVTLHPNPNLEISLFPEMHFLEQLKNLSISLFPLFPISSGILYKSPHKVCVNMVECRNELWYVGFSVYKNMVNVNILR